MKEFYQWVLLLRIGKVLSQPSRLFVCLKTLSSPPFVRVSVCCIVVNRSLGLD
jgi:hypothetical protein